MTIKLNDASIYTDFQALDGLRRSAENNSPEALTAVAKQFEALFLQQIFKGMRDAKLADGLMESDAGDLYQDMFDKQMALNLAQGKGIGLADLLVEQIRSKAPGAVADASHANAIAAFDKQPELQMPHGLPISKAPVVDKLTSVTANSPQQALNVYTPAQPIFNPLRSDRQPDTDSAGIPEKFLNELWDAAQQAATALHVDVRVILAQSALETGWGQFVAQRADGASSNNLFNIKADSRWSGPAVNKPTLEIKDGVAQQEQARFRAYETVAESFKDYVNFLQQSPRYAQALKKGQQGGAAFIEGLQSAGYATDPAYAEKIARIADSELMNRTLATLNISDRNFSALKFSENGPPTDHKGIIDDL